MKKYDVLVVVKSFAFLKVEAKNEEEAQYIAQLKANELVLQGVNVELLRLDGEKVSLNCIDWNIDVEEIAV